MAGRVEGKVAFVTGAARGQGRSHALKLAEEGADIIAVDICKNVDHCQLELSSPGDLLETKERVEALGRRIIADEADVRDFDALKTVVDRGVAEFGRLDIILANAGIGNGGQTIETLEEPVWQTMMDINLTGVWKTVKAGIPHMIAGGRGGSIVLTSSVAGLKAYPQMGQYVAAKHGVVGLMRSLRGRVGAAHDPGEQRASHPCQHPAGDEPADLRSVPARPGNARPRRHRTHLPDVPHHAEALGGGRGHHQRRDVFRFR